MTDLVTIQIVKVLNLRNMQHSGIGTKRIAYFLFLECACNADVTLQDDVTLVVLFSLFQLLFPPPPDSILGHFLLQHFLFYSTRFIQLGQVL